MRHPASCFCCGHGLRHAFDRRRFLMGAGGGAAALLGVLGQAGKQLKQFGWIHEMACPSPNVLFVAELLNWRVQKLMLHA